MARVVEFHQDPSSPFSLVKGRSVSLFRSVHHRCLQNLKSMTQFHQRNTMAVISEQTRTRLKSNLRS